LTFDRSDLIDDARQVVGQRVQVWRIVAQRVRRDTILSAERRYLSIKQFPGPVQTWDQDKGAAIAFDQDARIVTVSH
jgi:hypothetical protein